jgi:hypothetical protein
VTAIVVVIATVTVAFAVSALLPLQDRSAERDIRAFFEARNGEVLAIECAGWREQVAHWYARGLERAYTVSVRGDGRTYRYVLIHGGIVLGPLSSHIKIIREISPDDVSRAHAQTDGP